MALHEKRFEYEAQLLVPFISNGPLIFWLYPLFGIRGAIWFLGVYEGSGSPRDINLFAETGRDASNQGAPSGDGSGDAMRPTRALHDLGQSLWLDNITRELLDGGTLRHYVEQLSVTELTSNPTIFTHAIRNSASPR